MAPPSDLLLDVAVRAAFAGGAVLRDFTGATEAEAKGAGDYVSAVDRRSETEVRGVLEDATPDVPLLGEEEGGRRGDRYWVVDPLDGTTNFLHGFPINAVSVALVELGRPVVGVVHAPFLGETISTSGRVGRVEL